MDGLFERGDWIYIRSGAKYHSGKRVKIIEIQPGQGNQTYRCTDIMGTEWWVYNSDIIPNELRTNPKNMNSLTEKIRLLKKPEPEKSFIKAGVTTMSGDFTSEGQVVFLQYLLEKNKDDFNTTVVQSILADKEHES